MSDAENHQDPRVLTQQIAAEDIPRCPKLDGSTLRIVSDYTEAGWFTEANVIAVTDGERTAWYVPLRKWESPQERRAEGKAG